MSRPGSYRLAAAFFAVCCAFALIGASNAATAAQGGAPTPSPVPLATSSAAPPLFAPAVLVYPFDVTGELKADAGNAIAQIFDQQFVSAGGLSVLPTPNGVKRADFLTNARGLKADYYISGYLTPVGDGAALVMQVVSVQSGIMVYTKTSQIFTAQDASAQAFVARQVMFDRSGVTAVAADTTQASTPAPTASQGAQVSLGGIGSLFGLFHHNKAQAGPQTVVAEADKPTRVAIVSSVGGTADAAALAEATGLLRPTLDRYFKTGTASTAVDGGKNASTICGSNRNATVVTGTLSQQRVGKFRGHTDSTFTLVIYTCFGATLYTGDPAKADSIKGAINAAVDAYAKDHPGNS